MELALIAIGPGFFRHQFFPGWKMTSETTDPPTPQCSGRDKKNSKNKHGLISTTWDHSVNTSLKSVGHINENKVVKLRERKSAWALRIPVVMVGQHQPVEETNTLVLA
ncbi:hypothetical protein HPP92_029145 [Vanilla planifolia]|uniref:Uncharacterized protein n=1 Tax=Vanilla planifolia TaxID=51239 RepID=A0A835U4H7_VANPL|nr:hypothetical protein HPP92_029145 [Vanilla planifolia]KAG0445838.1 hypothetical protein HPP92_029134 [Vanilla planifolia]